MLTYPVARCLDVSLGDLEPVPQFGSERHNIMRASVKRETARFSDMFGLGSLDSLREILWTSKAIISGSVALAIRHSERFIPGDIDFYATSAGLASLLNYIQNCGYYLECRSVPNPVSYDTDDPTSGIQFVLKLKNDTRDKSVNIIVCSDAYPLETVTRFHSTLVMNAVGWYGLVTLYPVWTDNDIGLIIVPEAMRKGCFAKYRGRGYTLVELPSQLPDYEPVHDCGDHPTCPSTFRSLYDEFINFIPFDNLPSDISLFEDIIYWKLKAPCD